MINVIHKLTVSIMDNGQIEVVGIPENLEAALLLIHNLTRVVIGFHLDRAINQNIMLQNQTDQPKLILMKLRRMLCQN